MINIIDVIGFHWIVYQIVVVERNLVAHAVSDGLDSVVRTYRTFRI